MTESVSPARPRPWPHPRPSRCRCFCSGSAPEAQTRPAAPTTLAPPGPPRAPRGRRSSGGSTRVSGSRALELVTPPMLAPLGFSVVSASFPHAPLPPASVSPLPLSCSRRHPKAPQPSLLVGIFLPPQSLFPLHQEPITHSSSQPLLAASSNSLGQLLGGPLILGWVYVCEREWGSSGGGSAYWKGKGSIYFASLCVWGHCSMLTTRPQFHQCFLLGEDIE